MPNILRYEEIIAHEPPTPDTFRREVQHIRETASDMYKEGLIDAAVLAGSAVVGDPSPQSDIDLLVVSDDPQNEELVENIRRMNIGIYRRSGIPLDVNCYSAEILRSGDHYYQQHAISFVQSHLAGHPEDFIGTENPFDYMQPPALDLVAFTHRYFHTQNELLTRAYRNGVAPNPEEMLERVLNMPHRLGRLAIGTLQTQSYIHPETLQSTNKQAIAQSVDAVLSPVAPDITPLYQDISDALARYPLLVEEVRNQRVGHAEYAQIIEATTAEYAPKSLALISHMHKAFRALVDKTTPTAP